MGPVTFVHVAAGAVVLGIAPLAMIVRKGGRWHRRLGLGFLAAMAGVTITASVMWQQRGHGFLLLLDLVTVYFLVLGYRVLARNRRGTPSRRADALDASFALGALAASVALIAGAFAPSDALLVQLRIVLGSLGSIGAIFAALELVGLAFGPRQRYGWLFSHLAAMIAAYVSAVTAFVVINAHGIPMTLRWFVPVALGALVISAFSAFYRWKFWRAARAARRSRLRRA